MVSPFHQAGIRVSTGQHGVLPVLHNWFTPPLITMSHMSAILVGWSPQGDLTTERRNPKSHGSQFQGTPILNSPTVSELLARTVQ